MDLIPHEDIVRIEKLPDKDCMQLTFYAFNTIVSIEVFSFEECEPALNDCLQLCRRYERLFSRTLPHSDVSRLNAANASPTPIDPASADLLAAALHYCAISRGCFDISIGSLTRLWNFAEQVIPDPRELQAALPHVNWENVELSYDAQAKRHFATIHDAAAAIDLGGIAKGWIADRISEGLLAAGANDHIINLGGNVLVHGRKPDGSPWVVGIRDPQDQSRYLRKLKLHEGSLVTSGTYERCFTKNGTCYHHILDPKTGYPVATDLLSATVLTRRSIDAEGFSTTLLALGCAQALDLARKHEEISSLVLLTTDHELIEYTRSC